MHTAARALAGTNAGADGMDWCESFKLTGADYSDDCPTGAEEGLLGGVPFYPLLCAVAWRTSEVDERFRLRVDERGLRVLGLGSLFRLRV